MNGAARRRGGSAGGAAGQRSNGFPPAPAPTGKVLVEGYRKDVLGGFDRERPRYDSPSETRPPPNSSPVDLKDPIQVHLLTETALGDSKTFEILSQEEVDDLKKQIQSLSTRIEQARANLAIQSKYRDAAISMARLYSPPKTDGKRRSLLGNNNSNRISDSAKEAEMEKQASERRCEELATELFSLEKRLMEPQRRLLQHTAGILQMTHRASAKNNKSGQPPLGPMMNGIPGSPESLYTYTNTRNSMELIPADDLDPNFDRSLYLPLDQPPERPATARPRKNTIEIPMKSPIREQNAQLRELREELDRANLEISQLRNDLTQAQDERARLSASESQLRADHSAAREEAARLREREQQLLEESARAAEAQTSRAADEAGRFRDADARMRAIEEQMGAEMGALREESAARGRVIGEVEEGLERLGRRLREVVVGLNPERNGGFGEPEKAGGDGAALRGLMEYLERGIAAVVEAQKVQAAEAERAKDEARAEASAASAEAAAVGSSLGQLEASLDQAGVRVQSLARQVHAVLQQSNSGQQPPPEGSLDDQLDYLEDALRGVGSELSRALEASSSASAKKKNIDQVDAVLMGLWEIIQSGYAEIEQQRAARRQNRAMGQGGDDDDDELSSNEFEGMTNEPYSLQAFSTKVQWLYAQATGLREQKYILQRQIKQQRELNNRSESEKDQEIQARADELQQTQQLLDAAERAAADAQDQLQRVLADMDTLQKTTAANEAASVSSTKAVQDQLKDRSARIAALESEVRDAQARLATAEASLATSASTLTTREAEISSLQSQLTAATTATSSTAAELTALQTDLAAKEAELDRMNTMVIELKTELTFAKAELDGAYGSRKQRAAEAAAALSSSAAAAAGNAQSGEQVARLRAELENTLRDLEEITRESIAAERERLDMEGRLDEAVSVRGELEAEVEGLRERLARVQEELDGERLKAPGGGNGSGGGGAGARSGAGASMLSEQFRGVMKEERRKFQEEMKEEQARRRKVEEELRALKRGQGAGGLGTRGALSPR